MVHRKRFHHRIAQKSGARMQHTSEPGRTMAWVASGRLSWAKSLTSLRWRRSRFHTSGPVRPLSTKKNLRTPLVCSRQPHRWTCPLPIPKSPDVIRSFHKMHGLGNDFVVLDARSEPIALSAGVAASLADRHRGIGCDQLIVIEPSSTADLRMRIYNADGGAAEACGNAARCVLALTGATSIETDGGLLSGSVYDGQVEVVLAEPRFGWNAIPLAYPMDTRALPLSWDGLSGPFAVNVGNPHLVFFVEAIDEDQVRKVGPLIEHDPAFPNRINVNVASIKGNFIQLRTWERGAGLTLACGTGACATAVAAIATKRVSGPTKVDMKGGSLTIDWTIGGTIRMRGPATHVFSGEIDLAAFSG